MNAVYRTYDWGDVAAGAHHDGRRPAFPAIR